MEANLARLFVIVGGFVVLVLTAALVAPLFVNWTNYRAEFEQQASQILGRPVKVDGIASARLIPFPSVTFEGIRVGEDPDDPVLTADRFSMDLELAPFLSGDVLIFDMRLDRPKGRLTIHEDGTVDWALRPETPFDPRNVKIENLVIADGRIDILDEAFGTSHSLEIKSGTLSARALTGPWKMSASLIADGEQLYLEASTGQPDENSKLPLRFKAFPAGRSIAIEGDGTAGSDSGRISYAGQFLLRPALLSDPAAASLRVAGERGGPAFRVSGAFDLKPEWLTLPEIRLETGDLENPYVATGKGAISFGVSPRFNISLDGNQVELSDKGDKIPAGSSLETRLAAFRDFVDAVPKPSMPGTIAVNLPAIVAGDTTIREVSFQAEPSSGGWRLEGVRATLPGRTKLEASGQLGSGGKFGFKGKLTVASTQPSGLAGWLGANIAGPEIRLLAGAGFSAHVDLVPGLQQFDELELVIGSSVFRGSASRRTDGERPLVELALKGEAIDLGVLAAVGSGLVGTEGSSAVFDNDIALTLDAGPVTAAGLEAQAFGLSARIKQSRADIDRLMMTDMAGASLSATGSISRFSTAPSATLDASIVSADGSELVSTLANRFAGQEWLQIMADRIGETPDLLSDLQISFIASTAPEDENRAWTLSGNIKAASGSASFAGNWQNPAARPADADGEWQVTATQAEPLNFLSLAGINLVPLGAPGPATLELKAKGKPFSDAAVEMAFSADGTAATFSGNRTLGADGPVLDGKATLVSDDFDPYLLATGLAFPGTGLGTPVSIETGATYNDKTYVLSDLAAKVGGIKAQGALTFDNAAERTRIEGSLEVDQAEGGWFLEMLAGAAALQPDGEGKLDTPFAGNPAIAADGRILLKADVFDLGTVGNAANASAELAFDAASMRIERFEADLSGGKLTGSVNGANQDGTLTLGSNFSLKEAKAESLMMAPGITGLADISGSWSSGGKTMDGIAASLTGSGVLTISNGRISGVNPKGLEPFLDMPMVEGKAPDEGTVEAMIEQSVLTGSFAFEKASAAWTAAGGMVKLPALRAQSQSTTLEAESESDIKTLETKVTGRINYDAGNQSLAGAETIVPFTLIRNAFESSLTVDPLPMTQFLAQRALEAEQERVEAMQAALSDKQRLRRDVRAVQLAYAVRDARSAAREQAVRQAAKRLGDETRMEWEVRKAALEEEERQKREADERAKAEKEARAAEAAAKSADALGDPDFTGTPVLPGNSIPALPDLQLDLNP